MAMVFGSTPAELYQYSNGDCWLLAGVISHHTGWPAVMFTDDEGATGHIMARMPDGRYVDVQSAIAEDEIRARWPEATIVELPEGLSSLEEHGWPDVDPYLCRLDPADVDDPEWDGPAGERSRQRLVDATVLAQRILTAVGQ